jgi:hypothetical protein
MRVPIAIAVLLISAPASAMDLQSFRTPSDNIHCMFITDGGATSVECELRSRTNVKPALPQPADCDLDWGNRFALEAKGMAGMVCHGDTLITPDAPVVDYGSQATVKGITCASEETGLTCKNRRGQGFSLSRAKQRLF